MPTLNWIGKEKVINHHLDVPYKILERKYSFDENGEHKKDNNSQNKIIHGDNLEALKSLLPEYEGKIKCIYIDPPYNTGNENWIYNDNVNDPKIKKWLGEIVKKEGEDLSRHDKWLCMMYPRLKLLQRLLSDDGAIFISIDDNEQANLKLICDEIFGKQNFLAHLTWCNKEGGGSSDSKHFRIKHEYIFCYAKNNYLCSINGVDISNADRYKEKDEYFNERGSFYLQKLGMGSIQYSESLDYHITAPDGTEITPAENNNGKKACWRWSKEKFLWGIKNGFVVIKKDRKDVWTVYTKQYMNCDNNGVIIHRTQRPMGVIEQFSSTQSAKYLKSINIEFNYSKPKELIEYLLKLNSTSNSIILDSFAGSGTTAHAVLNMNKIDKGNRKFILVEMEDYAESITAKRVKRVIGGYKYTGEKKTEIYSKKLTSKNLLKSEKILKEANEVIEVEKNNYDKISKPKIQDNCLKVIAIKKHKDKMDGLGGNFSFYELGEPLLLENRYLNEDVPIDKIRQYIYFTETKQVLSKNDSNSHLLDKYNNTAYYFYYERENITTLNFEFLKSLVKAENYVIYADRTTLDKNELLEYHIKFKKIPRDISKL